MSPVAKALIAALVGAIAPQSVSTLHLPPEVLAAVQAVCGAVIAVIYLFTDKPKQNPTTKDDPPPTDPGGN